VTSDGKVLIEFKGTMTIRNVDATRSRLLDALAEGSLIELDCTAVEEADLSFIQVLLAARSGAIRMGKTLRLAAPAQGALRGALERGGFVGGSTAGEDQFWTGGASN